MKLDDWNDVGEGFLFWGLDPRYWGSDFCIHDNLIRGVAHEGSRGVFRHFAIYPGRLLSKLPPDQQRERMETLLALCQIKYGKAG